MAASRAVGLIAAERRAQVPARPSSRSGVVGTDDESDYTADLYGRKDSEREAEAASLADAVLGKRRAGKVARGGPAAADGRVAKRQILEEVQVRPRSRVVSRCTCSPPPLGPAESQIQPVTNHRVVVRSGGYRKTGSDGRGSTGGRQNDC